VLGPKLMRRVQPKRLVQ